jgi:HlyD family secretion protein
MIGLPASRTFRKTLKWGLPLVVVGFLLLRFKFMPMPVMSHTTRHDTVVAEVMGTGTLEARVQTTLSPRIQERLAVVLVDQGDWVQSGQLLAQLEDGELKRLVEVAEAAVISAKALAQRVREDEARATAVEHQARLAHQRIAGLLTNQVSSQADFDKAVEQLSIANADLRRAQAAIVEAESQIVTAEKNLAYQRERLTYTRILSPYDGLVVRRDRDPGDVVVPGGSLLQLISTNEIWVSAWVDETAIASLATGQTARVVFRSEPAKDYPGTVARLGREADRETREFLVDVRVTRLPPTWAVGQRAEVYVETGRKSNTLALPARFVRWREGRPGVFVNAHGQAAWHPVTLGLRGRGQVEITQGLAPGDSVATPADPKQELSEGRRVRVRTTEPGGR